MRINLEGFSLEDKLVYFQRRLKDFIETKAPQVLIDFEKERISEVVYYMFRARRHKL
jgi:hypothetical protein